MNKRIEFLDIAKGILIITVILSHSPWPLASYMYWFHMPAFFIISGILYRDNVDFKKQLTKFYIPYLSFSIFDILFNFAMYPGMASMESFFLSLRNYIYSGKATWGVFWFIPVLLMTKFLFSKLRSTFKTPYIIFIVIVGYVLVHMYSIRVIPNLITDINNDYWFPLNIDVVPMALAYYSLGFYSKNILNYLTTKISLIVSGLGCLVLIYINVSQGIYFYINMKSSYYKSTGWDLIFPICFTIFILAISNNLPNGYLRRFLNYCGANSLIIMYLHKPLGTLMLRIFPSIGWLGFTLSGLLLSLMFNLIINKSSLLKTLFKGKYAMFSINNAKESF